MERPFWTVGQVPANLLADLALPRPRALAQALAALAGGDSVLIQGGPQSGRSTFLAQVAAAHGRPTLLVDEPSLLQGTSDEALAAAGQALNQPVQDWHEVAAALGPGGLVAFDGPRPDWPIPGPVLALGDGVRLDALEPAASMAFLSRRCARLRVHWTPSALRDAATLAEGHPARLQAIGAACLHVALERGRRRIALDDYLEAALEVSAQAARDLTLDGPRRQLLKAIVRAPDATPTQWAQRCGLEPRAATVHLGRLVADGWLQRPDRGRYVLADRGLAMHLQVRHAAVARVIRPLAGAAKPR
jgi:hypothetical protein